MIEISHNQARRMLREGLDRRLPEEQWAALQAHLEHCAECSAYRDRLRFAERGLSRTLQHRWAAVRGPLQDLAVELEKNRKARERRQKWTKRIAIGLGVFLLIFLYGTYQSLSAPRPTPEPPTAEPQIGPTRTSTPRPLTFHGVVAYSSFQGDNFDVRLINAGAGASGAASTNLTASSANESSPAWSPDGEWLAFLSDRLPENGANAPADAKTPAQPKTELYVMHIAGSRLTRLTDAPGITWHGPLSWSSDGKHIALIGERTPTPNQPDPVVSQQWVYLAGLDGSGAFSVAHSRGASGLAVFAPNTPNLAFSLASERGQLLVYHSGSAYFSSIQANKPRMLSPLLAPGTFAWSPGGQSVVYLSEAQGQSQVRLSSEMDVRISSLNPPDAAGTLIDAIPGLNHFRAVAWVPDNLLVVILQDARGDGCWTVRLRDPYHSERAPRDLYGLCADGDLGPENFTPDGQWLVLRAHLPNTSAGPRQVSFYALRLPQDVVQVEPVYYEKLADIDVESGQTVLPEPVVRPAGPVLNLLPRAVQPAQPEPPRSALPDAAQGSLYYSRLTDPARRLARIMLSSPDGARVSGLTPENARATCPERSPDGKRVAFVSNLLSPGSDNTELYAMNADGSNISRLTGVGLNRPMEAPSGILALYDCPVWSPDGRFLAAVLRYQPERGEPTDYLNILPMVEGASVPVLGEVLHPYRFIKIDAPSYMTLPRWTPDSKRLLLVYPSYSNTSRAAARLVMLDLAQVQEDGQGIQSVLSLSGWTDLNGLEFSPDGEQVAIMPYSYNANSRDSQAQLRVLRADNWTVISAPRLANFDYSSTGGPNTLGWLPDGRIALVRHTDLSSPIRAVLEVYDPNTLRTDTVFQVEDIIYNAAWSPDGRWVAYTSEGGLYLLDFASALTGENVAPLLLDSGMVYDLVWR